MSVSRHSEREARVWLKHVPTLAASSHDAIRAAISFTEYDRCAGDALESLHASLAARIVRDAGMLDTFSAVGIARAFMFGGYQREAIWLGMLVMQIIPSHLRMARRLPWGITFAKNARSGKRDAH